MKPDTARRVKCAPYAWEQHLLTLARAVGGQPAVDRMAERIARHNDAVKNLLLRQRDLPWFEKIRIRDAIEAMGESLRMSAVIDAATPKEGT